MKSGSIFFICVIFLWYQLFIPAFSGNSILIAQEGCSQYISAAEEKYYGGKFDEAIELIKLCLKQPNRSTDVEFKALKILCQAYLAKDFREAAREVAKKLLKIRPDYSPTIEQEPPPFIVLINEVRTDSTPAAKSDQSVGFFEKNKSLLWIVGGGAVLIGLTAILAAGGDDKKNAEPLSNPPDWPDSE
jgi:tetratricopeptide (TPR) repeat protein